MNKSFNKKRIWRKTYGKVFIKRKAICIAQMAMASAQAVASINIVGSAFGDLSLKAVATAEHIINFSKCVNDINHKMNEGFATK